MVGSLLQCLLGCSAGLHDKVSLKRHLHLLSPPPLPSPRIPSLPQVGDTVMALQRAVLQPGGREMIVYGTISGAIGKLCGQAWMAMLRLHF